MQTDEKKWFAAKSHNFCLVGETLYTKTTMTFGGGVFVMMKMKLCYEKRIEG